MTKRDDAAEEYVLWAPEITSVRDVRIARAAYIAGWNARKQAEYEAAFNVPRPLHASAYEPLTPFKPKFMTPHVGPALAEIRAQRNGDESFWRKHDGGNDGPQAA
jgi:hypothetical protein